MRRRQQSPQPLLILDPDIDHGTEMQNVAGEHGFEPVLTHDVRAFREHCDKEYRVIVIDLMTEEANGIEIIRELADSGCDASLIVIGDTDRRILNAAERLARARHLKVAGVLPKPVNRLGLLRLLDRAVKRQITGKADLDEVELDSGELLGCIEDDGIEVQYQPKIDVRTLEFVSVETLVRLKHPVHGVLEPASFLVLVEESGLIERLTEEVARKSLKQSAEWKRQGLSLQVAINVSPLLLIDLDMPDRFAKLADEQGVDRDTVVLEITESWANQDDVAALDILTRLRMKGFHLSIDDFGTGYSTMAQLNELPYSEMKLDQTFIRNCARDAEARAIVESSIDLGHKLGMKVVAEGIEKQEDWDLISDLRCDEGQGYFIARPMRGQNIPDWLSHWNTSLGRV